MRWLDATEQAMWRGYLDTTRTLFRALDRQLIDDADIPLADYEILAVLSEAPARCLRMREIADAMVASRGGATRAVKRLVDAGWVRRMDCPADKRGALAELTDAGAAKLADAAPGHVATVRQHVFDLLTRTDINRFSQLYTKIGNQLHSDVDSDS